MTKATERDTLVRAKRLLAAKGTAGKTTAAVTSEPASNNTATNTLETESPPLIPVSKLVRSNAQVFLLRAERDGLKKELASARTLMVQYIRMVKAANVSKLLIIREKAAHIREMRMMRRELRELRVAKGKGR